MNNFDMIVISEEKENILVVMKTSEPPFDYLAEIEASLREKHYIGVVMIDELLHSGNTEERFIQGYFDGARFDSGQFAFELWIITFDRVHSIVDQRAYVGLIALTLDGIPARIDGYPEDILGSVFIAAL